MKDTPTKIGSGKNWSPKDKPEQVTWYFAIEWKENKPGQFSTKKEAQTKFTVGTEIEIVVSERSGKPFYDIVRQQFSGGGGSRFNLDCEREKQREIQKCVALKNAIKVALSLDVEFNHDEPNASYDEALKTKIEWWYLRLKNILTGNEYTGEGTEEKAAASEERKDKVYQEALDQTTKALKWMEKNADYELYDIEKEYNKPILELDNFQLRGFIAACKKVKEGRSIERQKHPGNQEAKNK